MGGTAVDDPDEFDVMEIALEDEPDELAEDSVLVFGLKGGDCPVNLRGVVSVLEMAFFTGR